MKTKTYKIYLKEILGGYVEVKAMNKISAKKKAWKVIYSSEAGDVMKDSNGIEIEVVEEIKPLKKIYHL